ncbi:MAG: MBL fold metallo-hydrolase [Desulfofustis sp.]|nr:MBL fold metallo-hydrolase [Desulfofustis sp.]NNF45602.1 MBL fold metallo-hydrolase [Desulfofustis sp.]NNK57041.1 MBL fold metallo-hydrolase [Desulfofustis sp.]RZW25678.1 MAG: MBL fold metallo-hydrolase [Desulfobulbaceae bacterium]
MIPQQLTIETPYMVGPVHCYTLDLGDELILFDTGPPTEAGRDLLKAHLDLSRLSQIIITHGHIDHCGQAAWLAQNSDADVYLPRLDIHKYEQSEQRLSALFSLIADLGFRESYIEVLRERFTKSAEPLRFPDHCKVAEEELPPRLGVEVIGCPGHSQTDLIYAGNGWAVTGDTLLRGVFQSPLLDVNLETGGRFRNYQAYCASIVKLAGLRSKKILPGHRQHVVSVEHTLLFYLNKMLRRVDFLLPQISSRSVAELINELFPSMIDVFHIYLKASEIVFMKDFLAQPVLLASALKGIDLYESLEEPFCNVAEKQ